MGDGDPFPRPLKNGNKIDSLKSSSSILPDFDIRIDFPKIITVNKMLPLPDKLSTKGTAVVILTNNSGRDEMLYASNPCEIHHWDLVDEDGCLVESEKDGLCNTVTQNLNLKAESSIRSDYVVSLNGKLLKQGDLYKLRFKFWGFEAEASFEVRFTN